MTFVALGLAIVIAAALVWLVLDRYFYLGLALRHRLKRNRKRRRRGYY